MRNNINLNPLNFPLYSLLNNQICECECLIDEHSNNGVCYGLKFNGTIYSACGCKRFKPLGLNINLYSEIETENESLI